jgi:hypothetical protein
MPLSSALAITLSAEQPAALEHLVRAPSTPQQLALRARIILLADNGTGRRARASARVDDPAQDGAPVAATLAGRSWQRRRASRRCATRGCAGELHRRAGLRHHRPGLRAAVRSSPAAITHGSQNELAREAVKRRLAPSISHRSSGRMLKRSRPEAASDAVLAHAQARP